MTFMAVILAKNVSKVYENGSRKTYALRDVSFEIKKGEFAVVLGQSGAGKSTLLNILGGIDSLTTGEMTVNEIPLSRMTQDTLAEYRANEIGFIFQFYNLIPNLTVYENVAHSRKFPSQLSGGEQQRVSIARAVVKNPQILLCDEPTGALDSETGCTVLQLIWDVCREYGKTAIIVTHNSNIAKAADQVIRLRNGRITEITENENPVSVKEVEW